MVILRKKEVTKDKISYYYKLSEDLQEGVLVYLPKDNIFGVEFYAQDDKKDFDFFRQPAYQALEDFYKNENYPEEKIIMWY